MRLKTKIFTLLLAAAMVISMCGCALESADDTDATTTAPAASIATDSTIATEGTAATEGHAATEEHSATVETTSTDEPEAEPTLEINPDVKAGDIVKFGTYEQDGNVDNGKEDIEWIVLRRDGDNIFVLSKYALDAQPYNSSTAYNIAWETSTLRQWLNDDFLHEAFNKFECSKIKNTEVKNMLSSWEGNNTIDKVFLLDESEYNMYAAAQNAKLCFPTEYYVAKMTEETGHDKSYFTAYNGTVSWSLRQSGRGKYINNGIYASSGDASADQAKQARLRVTPYGNNSMAVRPAMWINIGTEKYPDVPKQKEADIFNAEVGDIIKFGQYKQDGNIGTWNQDIEWIVLEKSGSLLYLVSRYGLYQDSPSAYGNNYTTIMSHLNDEFFYQAFSEEERRIVKDIYPTDVEYNKICKVTLLSQEEVQRYFPENMRLCSPARIYQGTEMLNSITVQIGARESWWLRGYERSPKSVDITGKIVGQFGKIIRPAICIDPELYTHSNALVEEMKIGADVNIGDIVEFGRYEQDNDTSNGKEKIEWLVLDKTDDAVFVISKNIIETEIYDNLYLRDSDGNNIVNGKMFNTVLESREEQDNVLLTILAYYMGRAELSGKMFLIDYETFERYRSIIESVEFQMTPYVLAKTSDKTLRFALRGQKYVQEYKDEYNNLSMSTGDIRYTYNYDAGIRPAMWIKINSD